MGNRTRLKRKLKDLQSTAGQLKYMEGSGSSRYWIANGFRFVSWSNQGVAGPVHDFCCLQAGRRSSDKKKADSSDYQLLAPKQATVITTSDSPCITADRLHGTLQLQDLPALKLKEGDCRSEIFHHPGVAAQAPA